MSNVATFSNLTTPTLTPTPTPTPTPTCQDMSIFLLVTKANFSCRCTVGVDDIESENDTKKIYYTSRYVKSLKEIKLFT